MNQLQAFDNRIARLREILSASNNHSIVLRKNPNLAWAIGGRVHVPFTLDAACFDLIVTNTSVIAVTNAIEAPRLIAEEFPEGIEVKVVNWWEGRDGQLPSGAGVASDVPGGECVDLSLEVEKLRQSLNEFEIERFREVSVDAATALGDALKSVKPGLTEIDVAGLISEKLWEKNLDLCFLGVAGESRVKKFRHPLPTAAPIGNKVVASICARRKGLIASATRIATFGKADDYADYLSILKVEQALLDATVVGATFAKPIEAVIPAYAANGFDADEWTRHHQGGPTGFLPRDWTANRSSTRLIQQNQPISWNPTGKGWKAEDTIIATSNGIEILSNDSSWPSIEVGGRPRPDVLEV